MKQVICVSCGASEYIEINGYRVCQYCDTKFDISYENISSNQSYISLNDDIKMLLKKCQEDPINARRYANLVLDLDPGNDEAIKYLRR